ncbi:MAG: metal transporter [Chloroflexi bacterium]|nr:metal transporter [Chloroflexota bacterium]
MARVEAHKQPTPATTPAGFGTLIIAAVLPLVLLAAVLGVFLLQGDALIGSISNNAPPVEKLTVERIAFREDEILVKVVNGGPAPVELATVFVDEAIWAFNLSPEGAIPRLGTAHVSIPYRWIEGEPHKIKLLSTTGIAFEKTADVALRSPSPSPAAFGAFAFIGLYAGVVPVYLGLLWFPLLRRIGRGALRFLLAFTAGLLVFLGIDAIEESLELAHTLGGAYHGTILVFLGVVIAFLAIAATSQWLSQGERDTSRARLTLAYMVALGIGLHNFGEGLAIGAAFVLGEIALGTFLIIGFMLHNTTEGLAIVAPVSKDRPAWHHFLLMGLLAGAPMILGAWFGGFTYSALWATIFLAIGAGAIFQVVWEIGKMIVSEARERGLVNLASASGLVAGLLVMYATALFIAK